MNPETSAPLSAGSAVDGGVSRPTSGWLRFVLLGVIIALLAALIAIPLLIDQRTDAMRDRLYSVVVPAREALQENQVALASALAAVTGYQLSGDTVFLVRLEHHIAEDRTASERLTTLAAQLGPETVQTVDQFRARAAIWLERPRALVTGEVTRDELSASHVIAQGRFEATLSAGEDARAALDRAEADLEERISASTRLERQLVLLLSLAALGVALIVGWLTRRLDRLSRELRTRAERLHESEERFRMIAENLREMIWISDPAYTVQYYLSPAYGRIWGRPIEEAKDNPRSFLESVLPEDRPRVEEALEGYARGEYQAEYRIRRPNGEVRWISGRGYPVCDEQGRVFRVVGIAEDISEQKRAEQEREELLERERAAHTETEAALHMRDRVLRIVSHDLKNPLHTIGMAADVLEMPLPDEQRSGQIAIIRRTVARANRMVLDLLDAARIHSGQGIAVEPRPVKVGPLLGEAIETFRPQAEKREQELVCDVPEELPTILADYDRILQVLSNLLGNAVKFTPKGGRIRVLAEPEGDEMVRFTVSNTGPGIEPDLLPHLFEPFSQARDTASLGSGLGLSIACGLVEAHGGHISVQSDPGKETTFCFTLPTDARST